QDALRKPLTSYYLLLVSSALLLVIGLIMVLSASSVYSYRVTDGADSYSVVKRQLVWVVLGLPLAFVASRMPVRWFRRLSWVAVLMALVLLGATAVAGVAVNGNQNWLALGPVRIQPAEFAKLALVLWAAHVYANKDRRLDTLHQIVVPVVPIMTLAAALVIVGDDLGTAMIIFAILLGLLWIVGSPGRAFGFIFVLIAIAAAYMAKASPHRLDRIATFTDPFSDYLYSGWQPVHGLYALSSGGIWGQGIGASQQKWGDLPEAHTDFIFAVLGEELGLIGTLLVIALFLVVAYSALRIAREATDMFVRYFTFGVVVWLVGQAVINIGMVLGMLPVIGIPLPLLSYGGSALVPSLVAIGMVLGFARREPAAAAALALRDQTRRSGRSTRAGSAR
ncbi:MAG: putative lipid II flippase FtsW, partial [Nocardioides sp.]